MLKYGIEILIAVILSAIAVWAIYRIVKKARRGGGCCGDHEAKEKRIAVKDRRKSHYPFSVVLKISGMACQNCAKRVENALNTLDGVWATVDLNSNTARVLSKRKANLQVLCGTVAKAGYAAEPKNH